MLFVHSLSVISFPWVAPWKRSGKGPREQWRTMPSQPLARTRLERVVSSSQWKKGPKEGLGQVSSLSRSDSFTGCLLVMVTMVMHLREAAMG